MDIITLLVSLINFIFITVLVVIGVFLAFLDSVGVTVETDLIVDFIFKFLFVHSWLLVLCRICVSLYNSYASNKLREYLLSLNFYILLILLWIFW